MKHYVILLATDDAAVESVVKALGDRSECELNCVKTSREAVSMLMDGSLNQDFAVVDFDMREGGRALMRTAGGALPVIAVSRRPNPWLSSMLKHRRIGATLTKPVSPEKLSDAFHRMQGSLAWRRSATARCSPQDKRAAKMRFFAELRGKLMEEN